MSLEYQRYGRNKKTLVNSTYINSGEYRHKFDNITDNTDVSRVLYSKAKKMLKHRSGTMIEDMYWIDKSSGAVVASIINQTDDITERIDYPDSVIKMIADNEDLIAMHTHPQSMPPSAADFNAAFHNGYAVALVICHDGTIFQYSSNANIDTDLYDAYIRKYMKEGFSEYDAQINALEQLKENFDIDFWEVKP